MLKRLLHLPLLLLTLAIANSCTTLGINAPQSAAVAAQNRPAASDAASRKPRQDFLQLIDRPRVPPAPEISPVANAGAPGLSEFHFTFASDKSNRVPGILLTPAPTETEGKPNRHPVVIYLHGTGGKKEDGRAFLTSLANRGFIAVAIDAPYHGERAATAPKEQNLNAYETAVLHAYQHPESHAHPFFFDTVWDVMRLIDYLNTRDDVDPARIGLYGVSKGGIETYLAAAVDPRIAVAVPCISVESFQWALDNNRAWTHRIETIQKPFDLIAKAEGITKPEGDFVAKVYDRICPGINAEFDGPAMVPLIAPRPLLTINGELDPRTPPASLKLCTDAAQSAYHAAKADDHLLIRIQPNTAHKVNPDSQTAAVEWFAKWLKPEK